ncbi:MAG: PVC-type heme-binding CxxCH protein [Fuerstiella sp.]
MNQPSPSDDDVLQNFIRRIGGPAASSVTIALAVCCFCSASVIAQATSDQQPADFQAAVRTTEPLSDAEQQATFSLPDGFRISCFASEPDLQKPMNMAFDSDGRLWVTGSHEYPIAAADGAGGDSVRILEDTNGDGAADSVTVFADDLNIPIGLLPYGDGAIVFSIPNILYLEDTNLDGVADKRTKLYGPFDTSRDTHGMTNSFTAFHDGWVYACHGFNNQSTVAGSDGHAITMISGNTYRFRPDGSRIEIVTRGQVNPFGMTFDDVGDLFTSDCHSKPVNLLISGGYHESFGKPNDGLGFIPDVMNHQHGSTAIDGVTWYDGSQFPESFRDRLYLGNVMTGRIHRNRIVRDGATVTMRQEDDLVISSDPWFRPVDIQCGPDGCLYIADFYNRIIGHYEVPLDHPGRDRHRGRIWKVEYVAATAGSDGAGSDGIQSAASTVPKLSNDSLADLLKRLNDERLQIRTKAAELIVDYDGAEADLVIRESWNALGEDSQAKSSVHLLWILQRRNMLQIQDLQKAMSSSNIVFRSHAMKVCAERKLSDSLAAVVKLGLRDPDHLVQRSAALAASKHGSVLLFKELVNAMVVCPAKDVCLLHSLKIALRNQLQHDFVVDWFLKTVQPKFAYQACLKIIGGLKTDRTASLAVAILQNTEPTEGEVAFLIGHAATYANSVEANQLVDLCQKLPTSDLQQLVQIREVLADAFDRNQGADPTKFQAFESSLLDQLAKNVDVKKLNWGRYQWDDRPAAQWQLEERQKSNSRAAQFLSSLPSGESAVGILRSKTFVVPFQQTLELCGHLGTVGQPPILDNQLVLRESKSGAVLRAQSPPRQDQAIKVSWSLADVVGKRAVLELQDGVDRPGYAWLALGPVSPAVANVFKGQQDAQQLALRTMVQILDGREVSGVLDDDHVKLLEDVVLASQVNGETRQFAAAVLFRHRDLAAMAPLSVLLKYGALSLPVQNEIAAACAVSEPWILRVVKQVDSALSPDLSLDVPTEPISKPEDFEVEKSVPFMDRSEWRLRTVQSICGDLPEFYGLRVAREMAATKQSALLFVQAMATGGPSATLLRDETLVNLLKSHGQQLASEVDELLKSLPKEERVPQDYFQAVLRQFKAAQLRKGIQASGSDTGVAVANLELGKVIFERHCVVCHRKKNKGGLVGPQLDGIQTRGPQRLLEDILYPHRNVDVAFRTSVLLLKSGKTISGPIRRQEDGKMVSVANVEGQFVEIPTDEIERVIPTSQSLMPSGFHKLLTEQQMANLLLWLCN